MTRADDRAGLVLPIANIQAKVNAFLRRTVLPGLPSNWSRNWLRQSYASYRLAQTGKVLQTAAENGHYAYILESVYLNLSDEADALAFFSLSPEACGKSNWNTRIAKFLETQPELHARPLKEKKWKPIGGDKSRATPLPAQQPTELAA